jgi:Zn-dependent protease with chaperone function
MTKPSEHSVAPEDLLAALAGRIEPVRKSPLYVMGLLLVALGMILLPLIYLALVAAAAYGVYYHATRNITLLHGTAGMRTRMLAYGGPLVVGSVIVLFLIKPLFVRPPKRPAPYSLEPQEQPTLFAYVRRLSELVGAPVPRRIDVDCDANASASFRRGILSMAANDLVLSIGLPLVAGLDLRQLTGILAHELGHFAQGGGMRLAHVIRRVSYWFARVVHDRDAFDVWLGRTTEETGYWPVKIILLLATGCVWLSRRILWVLMMVGNALSCFLLRQMEFDADRYEARVAGSGAFEATARRLLTLGVATHSALRSLEQSWTEQKLADDYPRLLLAHECRIPAAVREQIWSKVLERRTGWLDTHPAERDRIASARREDSPGLVQLETPAQALFDDFARLSRSVTAAHYAQLIGCEINGRALIATSDLVEKQAQDLEELHALHCFFQGHLGLAHLLFPAAQGIEAPEDLQVAITSLRESRDWLIQPPETNWDSCAPVAERRLVAALGLLRVPEIARQIEGFDARVAAQESERLLRFLHRIAPIFPDIQKLGEEFRNLVGYLNTIKGNEKSPTFVRGLSNAAGEVRGLLLTIHSRLEEIPYPFDHAEGEIPCSAFAVPGLPQIEDLGGIARVAQCLLNRMFMLYFRVMGNLVAFAEKTEAAVGLPRLSAPAAETEGPPAATAQAVQG